MYLIMGSTPLCEINKAFALVVNSFSSIITFGKRISASFSAHPVRDLLIMFFGGCIEQYSETFFSLAFQSCDNEMVLPRLYPPPLLGLSDIATTSLKRYKSEEDTDRLYLFSNISLNLKRGRDVPGTSCKRDATSFFKVSGSTFPPIIHSSN